MVTFVKAIRSQVYLKGALIGPSGSGKSLGALLIAKGIGGKTAMVDTEARRSEFYADRFDFDVMHLDAPYTPERYIECIEAAEQAGYEVLVIDSASHEWIGQGGCLEIVDSLKGKGNDYTIWGKVTPRHNNFVNAIVNAKMHIIFTLRGKDEYVLEESSSGKKVPRKVGLGAQMRDGLEYECAFSLLIDQQSHTATPMKDNTGVFEGTVSMIAEAHGRKLITWARSGAAVTRPATPPPPPASQASHGFKTGDSVVEVATGETAVVKGIKGDHIGIRFDSDGRGRWATPEELALYTPSDPMDDGYEADPLPEDEHDPLFPPDEPSKPSLVAAGSSNGSGYKGGRKREF